MGGRIQHDYPSDDELERLHEELGTETAVAHHLGITRATYQSHLWRNAERRERCAAASVRHSVKKKNAQRAAASSAAERDTDPFRDEVYELIKRKKRLSVEDVADTLDASPKRVREALRRLRDAGYRVPEERGVIELAPVLPDQTNLHKLDPKLLDGEELRVGVVSDTHLSSNEQALAELNLAYDHFEREGIREVWHAGDFTCGIGIFRGQDAEIFNHTFERQIEYLNNYYPTKTGIITRGISGNHDIEGDFGKAGANPVVALANKRPDIEFLGDYSAWIELPNGAWVHLLHPKGGMSYSVSYKAQKLVDGYAPGRKPAILIPGHWHVRGAWEARGVQVLWPGCFEWRSKFLERLGLHPAVGFHVLSIRLGEDGSLVRYSAEWFRFWEGRTVAANTSAA